MKSIILTVLEPCLYSTIIYSAVLYSAVEGPTFSDQWGASAEELDNFAPVGEIDHDLDHLDPSLPP